MRNIAKKPSGELRQARMYRSRQVRKSTLANLKGEQRMAASKEWVVNGAHREAFFVTAIPGITP